MTPLEQALSTAYKEVKAKNKELADLLMQLVDSSHQTHKVMERAEQLMEHQSRVIRKQHDLLHESTNRWLFMTMLFAVLAGLVIAHYVVYHW